MKVSVQITVNVDPEAWDRDYGTGTKADDVRADVKTYIKGLVDYCPPAEAGAIEQIS